MALAPDGIFDIIGFEIPGDGDGPNDARPLFDLHTSAQADAMIFCAEYMGGGCTCAYGCMGANQCARMPNYEGACGWQSTLPYAIFRT